MFKGRTGVNIICRSEFHICKVNVEVVGSAYIRDTQTRVEKNIFFYYFSTTKLLAVITCSVYFTFVHTHTQE